MNLREAQAHGYSRLYGSAALRKDALRDATLLLIHTLQVPNTEILAHHERELTAEQEAAYMALLARRQTHEPIQYIVGTWEFYGLDFEVTPAVLIPRSSTEDLIEAVLGELKGETERLRICDVGTGSGIIAIALAVHLPQAEITAVDLSPAALEVAARNAARNKVGERVRFLESDLLSGLPEGEPAFDAIVSNLPYVPAVDRERLHPQVRDHEPEMALFGGDDGLEIYRRYLPQARAMLKPGGLLALEMGHLHHEAMRAMLADWDAVRIVDDLEGIPRAALARRAAAAD